MNYYVVAREPKRDEPPYQKYEYRTRYNILHGASWSQQNKSAMYLELNEAVELIKKFIAVDGWGYRWEIRMVDPNTSSHYDTLPHSVYNDARVRLFGGGA